MASAEINRLMDNLRVRLPGAIDDAIKLEVYNTINDFFQDSNIWFEDIEFDVNSTDDTYTVTTNSGAIVRLMGVADNNYRPVRAGMDTPGEVQLYSKPSQPHIYTARMALTVNGVNKEGYPVFPMWVLNKYMNDVIDGVLGRMMAQQAKPYSNAQLALVHTRKFSAAVALARVEANRRNVYRGQNWAFPQGWSRRKSFR